MRVGKECEHVRLHSYFVTGMRFETRIVYTSVCCSVTRIELCSRVNLLSHKIVSDSLCLAVVQDEHYGPFWLVLHNVFNSAKIVATLCIREL